MKIVKVTASAGRTFNHPHEEYSNLRNQVTLEAAVGEDEDGAVAAKTLQGLAEDLAEDRKAASLRELGERRERERLLDRARRLRKRQYAAEALLRELGAVDPAEPIQLAPDGSTDVEQHREQTERRDTAAAEIHGILSGDPLILAEFSADRVCRQCGCCDDCACYDRQTGKPCHWVERDLCSVCARELAEQEEEDGEQNKSADV
ncbi:MAG TPA: hypothetical protein VMY35_11320 [Phycisphaerae bacterium]|nr:hypothetical protein [Phycisphaerae bacterium]